MSRSRFLIAIVVLISIAAFALAMKGSHSWGYWGEEDHARYLKFSHTFHVKEQGIDCETCHDKAKQSTKSTDRLIGDHETCKTCHEDQLSNNCGFCHTQPDNITAMPRPDREIRFSHELHAGKDTIACATCHAGMETATVATADNMPAMATCTSCHTARKVSTECATCHSDVAGLIPPDHLVGNFRQDHRRLTRMDGDVTVTCATCHRESFCQDCHTGSELHGFGSFKDLMADPVPRTQLRDTPRELKMQAVHDLNYRFTHGIDAKAKQADCATCHETQSFCATCHQAGGSINQSKFVPETHSQPGFVTIGKGSGGGLHAELGRRDLESCTSCHDVQGADPVCARCHAK